MAVDPALPEKVNPGGSLNLKPRALLKQLQGASFASLSEYDRSQAQLVSNLLLLLTGLLGMVFVATLVSGGANPYMTVGMLVLLLLYGGVYLLSRGRFHKLAAYLGILVTSVAVWGLSLANHTTSDLLILSLSFMVVPLMLSALLLPLPATAGLGLLHLVATFLLPVFLPGLRGTPLWSTLLVYLCLMVALTCTISARRALDQKRIQSRSEALAREQYLLNSLMDNIPDAIYFKDGQSRFLRVSKALVTKHGHANVSEVLGKTDFDYFAPEHANVVFQMEQEIIRSGKPVVGLEYEEVWPGRPSSWASVTKVPLYDSAGKIVGTFGISRDITDRKRAEQALKEANERQSRWIADLERRNREVALMNEMSDLLQSCQTVKEAHTVISELMRQLFTGDSGSLYMINSSRNLVELAGWWGAEPAEPRSFTPDECWGLRLGRLHAVERDLHMSGETGEASTIVCSHIQEPAPQAYICVPLVAQGEALGLLHVRCKGEEQACTWASEEKQQLARGVAARVALALANLRLRETLRQQSIRDPLTGLFNRRYLEESLNREVHRVARLQGSLGIIMLDLDHFKDFNDLYGHDAGDAVLRELGALLRSKTRVEDIACRYGGEEFVLILPGTTPEVTGERAELLRQAVRELQVTHNEISLGAVTISAGVACYPGNGATGEAVLRAADAALYQAKRVGRDKVELAEGTR